MKKIFFLPILALLTLTISCTDDVNNLAEYNGTWNVAIKMTSTMNGVEEMITETNSTVEITSDENVIYIEQTPYKVKKNTVYIPKITSKNTINNVVMETTMEANGTLLDNKIEIQQIMDTKTTMEDEIITMHQIIDMVFTKQ